MSHPLELLLLHDGDGPPLLVGGHRLADGVLEVQEAFGDLLLEQGLRVALSHLRFMLHWGEGEGVEHSMTLLHVHSYSTMYMYVLSFGVAQFKWDESILRE